MIERKLGEAVLKADYAAGKLILSVGYEKEGMVDLSLSVGAEAKQIIEAVLRPLVESSDTKLDDKALEYVLGLM